LKIAYILYWLAGPEAGAFKKILNQVRFWMGAGNEVTIVLAGPVEKQEAYAAAVKAIGARLKYFPIQGRIGRWLRWRGLKNYLRSANFEVIYHRYDLATPGIASAMEPGRWVVEMNTNDLTEYGMHPGFRSFYNRISRGRLFSRAAGSVFPTRELAADPDFSAFNSVREVIPNGGDFTSISQAPAPSATAPIELLFMGSDGHAWHGVNKLPALAAAQQDWIINVLGVSNRVFPNGAPPNIKLRGWLARKEYEPLLASCTIGIGSLAMHRIPLMEACPLKVREYLAFGLPVLIGYTDTDIPPRAPYALQIPNEEDNVATHVKDIRIFVEGWRGRRVPREMVQHMDWSVKEEARLRFISRVCGIPTRGERQTAQVAPR
jgi:hypothetical protein